MKNNRAAILLISIIVVGIIFGVFVFVKYGGKPITEIPSWAVPFFLGR